MGAYVVVTKIPNAVTLLDPVDFHFDLRHNRKKGVTMNLPYKGCMISSVEFSPSEAVFHGRVAGTKALIFVEDDSVKTQGFAPDSADASHPIHGQAFDTPQASAEPKNFLKTAD